MVKPFSSVFAKYETEEPCKLHPFVTILVTSLSYFKYRIHPKCLSSINTSMTSSLKLVPVIGLDEMSVVIHVLWDNGLWNIRTIKRRNDHDLYWYGCSQEDHHFLCT